MKPSGYFPTSIFGLAFVLAGQHVSYCIPWRTNFRVYWYETNDTGSTNVSMDYNEHLKVHRHIRSVDNNTIDGVVEEKDFFTEVSEFYSDKNNLAMYLVLPLLVVIYGGCSAIYCVAKCRQYLRRRKHKRLSNTQQASDDERPEDINESNETHSQHDEICPKDFDKTSTTDCRNSIASISDVNYNAGRPNSTPLPGQIEENDSEYPDHAVTVNATMQLTDGISISPRPQSNISRNNGRNTIELRPETVNSNRANVSETSSSSRSGSKNNDRENHTNSLNQDPDVIPTTEKRNVNKVHESVTRHDDHVEIDVQKSIGRFSKSTQEEISETNGTNYQIEQLRTLSMAKQAAQLLRVDIQNKRPLGVSKKQKRLVFVAE